MQSESKEKIKLWPVYVWSLQFAKPYIGILLLLILTNVIYSSSELVIPKFIQHFIDVILPSKNTELFYYLIAGLAGLIVLGIAASMVRNLLQRHLQEKAARDVQYSIFQHLRKLGFAYYEQNSVGQSLSLLNTEVGSLQALYRDHVPWLINNSIFSIISLAMMVSTSWRLSLIVVPCFLLYYIFGPMLERRASITGRTLSGNRILENKQVYESVSAITELRVFAAEKWDLNRYMTRVTNQNASLIKTFWYAYMRGTNRRITYYVGGIAIFIYGYYLVQGNEITVGQLVSFILLYFIAMHRLTIVVTGITEQKVLMHQIDRLFQFAQLKPQVSEVKHPQQLTEVRGEVRFEQVTFAYHPSKPILSNFDLHITPGQRVALVGTSGNGKSTVLKLLGRFYDPQAGRIYIDGIPIEELSFSSLRHTLGYVFQESYMFGSTVRENIKFGNPKASEEEVEAAAKAAYAHDFIMNLPDGYDTIVGERGVKLSGGQKQRIAIARMLIHNPSIIVLDEATSALDNGSEIAVQKAFQHAFQGKTVIAVAHRLSTIEDFDQIVVIEGGQVVEAGTYDELLAARGAFYQIKVGQNEEQEAGDE
ncbi:ABC transporter ATP-binding protein/permease [Paenibacillus sp. N1-5-1-14]|uniref:ABC transporter ATP-binding protein n=1 Tax=Paenibacillus radicibacter TaxID=2972488 RepID=UPI002159433C|nr:ABC transporter ATP-binding protein [Paenibacillus radicibacter]MCR8645655.1 ABC transporter ATP-binding protein/permease [Paenibacillus radicibacter]